MNYKIILLTLAFVAIKRLYGVPEKAVVVARFIDHIIIRVTKYEVVSGRYEQAPKHYKLVALDKVEAHDRAAQGNEKIDFEGKKYLKYPVSFFMEMAENK